MYNFKTVRVVIKFEQKFAARKLFKQIHTNSTTRNYDVALPSTTLSDGRDKPLCTKAITITDNFKNAQGDTDKR